MSSRFALGVSICESLASMKRTKIGRLKSLEDQAGEISNLGRKVGELGMVNADLQILKVDLHTVNASILSSYSWRITKPL